MKEILRSLRNKHNYSQSAVASYLEISRQMYNKYENGSAEPSIKNIKKLCELYKVSADVFFQETTEKKSNENLYSIRLNNIESVQNSCVASPTIPYGNASTSQKNNTSLLEDFINLLPKLKFSEQICLMSKLASLIEKQNNLQETSTQQPSIKQKKLKKIPDAEYNTYLHSEEGKKISSTGLSNIRELLKDDEW